MLKRLITVTVDLISNVLLDSIKTLVWVHLRTLSMTAPIALPALPVTELLALQQRVLTVIFVSQAQLIFHHILHSLETTSPLVLRLFRLVLVAIVLVLIHHLRIVLAATLFPQELLQLVSTVKPDALQTQQEITYHQVLLNPLVQLLDTVQAELLHQ